MSDTGKELAKLLASMKKKKKKTMIRYHIYGVIEQWPEDSSSLDDVLGYIQGYGSAEVIHVEVIDDENS